MTLVYKIRRRSDGKFSTGSATPTFTKIGKAWSSWGNLMNHMTLVRDGLGSDKDLNRFAAFYHDCEIVEFKSQERTIPAMIFEKKSDA